MLRIKTPKKDCEAVLSDAYTVINLNDSIFDSTFSCRNAPKPIQKSV
jgi:hypothetical protein